MKLTFRIYHEEYRGDEPKEIKAHSHWGAAVEYAEYYNTMNEYCLMDETCDIIVESESGMKIGYTISAEKSVTYNATEK